MDRLKLVLLGAGVLAFAALGFAFDAALALGTLGGLDAGFLPAGDLERAAGDLERAAAVVAFAGLALEVASALALALALGAALALAVALGFASSAATPAALFLRGAGETDRFRGAGALAVAESDAGPLCGAASPPPPADLIASEATATRKSTASTTMRTSSLSMSPSSPIVFTAGRRLTGQPRACVRACYFN